MCHSFKGSSRRLALRAQVHGTMRRSSYFNTTRLQDPRGPENPRRFQTHYADLCDCNSLVRVLSSVRPYELYNLGAQSYVQVSFDMPEFTTDVDGLGMHVFTVHCSSLTANCLEVIVSGRALSLSLALSLSAQARCGCSRRSGRRSWSA